MLRSNANGELPNRQPQRFLTAAPSERWNKAQSICRCWQIALGIKLFDVLQFDGPSSKMLDQRAVLRCQAPVQNHDKFAHTK
jgi:hypothetical protein